VCMLMSTTASAQGWERQNPVPTGNSLSDVVFVDASNGWAVGDSGTITHTTDGGGTWTVQASGTMLRLNDVAFVDANNGWVVGECGAIAHTTDGGWTWTFQSSDTGYSLNGVAFVDANNGWAVGDYGMILHTADGGETWTSQISGTGRALRGVDFVDENTGWAVGGSNSNYDLVVAHTTDGGATWNLQMNEGGGFGEDVDFVDADNGWAVYNGWGDEYVPYFFIIHTEDGGETWTYQLGNGTLFNICFVDTSNGWVVGDIWTPPGRILHTTDGGESWTTQNSGTENPLYGVTFVDASHGWAVGWDGTILRYNPTLQAPDPDFILHPSSFILSAYPNPFNPSTTIAYDLPKAGYVSLRVFDLLGREVSVLRDGFVEAGSHRVTFDGSGLPSGIYFARLDAGSFSQTKKLMLLK